MRSLRLLAALVGATLALIVFGHMPADATAEPTSPLTQTHRVGHTEKRVSVPDSATEGTAAPRTRDVNVHLWYPADVRGFSAQPKTVYKSALQGKTLIPDRWDPLSWTVEAEIAREEAPIDERGPAYPVIVFSHGSVNDPIDYAHTLERIAGQGFVVAAPSHVNNTQDDVRIDFINTQATALGHPRLFPCNDGRPPPCSRGSIPNSMKDRVRDITKVLNRFDPKSEDGPKWFEGRVDVDRAGVLGHSRGTATALAAAGGSAQWGFSAEPRVKAIMGLAIAAANITSGASISNVQAPTLLVAGGRDTTSPQPISEDAYEGVKSEEKAFVSIPEATHRSFDSTYCDQVQAVGRVLDKDGDGDISEMDKNGDGDIVDDLWELDRLPRGPDGVINPDELRGLRQAMDMHTLRLILNGGAQPNGTLGLSGKATQYCSPSAFTDPTNIEDLIRPLNAPQSPDRPPTPLDVPPSEFNGDFEYRGLETDEVKEGVTELATTFFGTVLKRTGNDGPHFTRYLAPKWLEKHEPMVGAEGGGAEASASAEAVCPPGQEVVCPD